MSGSGMTMKFLGGLTLLAAASLGSPAATAQETYHWTIASDLPPDDHGAQLWRLYTETVTERTNGRVTFEISYGGALGFKGEEKLGLVSDGTLQVTEAFAAFMAGVEPFVEVWSLPLLVQSWPEKEIQWTIVSPYERRLFEEKWDVIPLVRTTYPSQDLYLKNPVSSVEELAGLKLWPGQDILREIFPKFGATPVFVPLSELSVALATGSLDGQVGGIGTSSALNLEQVVPYLYEWNYIIGSTGYLFINGDTWRSLPADIQETMQSVGAELEAVELARVAEVESTLAEQWVTRGGHVEPVVPGLNEAVLPFVKPMWKSYAEAHLDWGSDKMIAELLQALGKSME